MIRTQNDAPLILLRRLRDIMATEGAAEQKLRNLVSIIASSLEVQVCSIYLIRAGDVLELFATEGLKAESVHQTRLRLGEGLAGDIAAHARPINLSDAQSHPKFAYRPETGEELYHGFLGVPILRNSQVLGVLILQSKERRVFSEDVVEVLLTVAMVLAELVGSGELVDPTEIAKGAGEAQFTRHLTGARLSPGIARGTAVLHSPVIKIEKVLADDTNAEMIRFEQAVNDMQGSVDALIQSADMAESGEHREIMESYRMFASDQGWLGRIAEAIGTGLTAEAAVKRVQDELRSRMSQITNHYLRERMYDLDDVAGRLLRHLTGNITPAASRNLPSSCVLIARAMGPAELLEYDRTKLQGIVLEEGSATSHIIIIARALDIPVVGRVEGATSLIPEGELVIIDGETGDVFVRPTDDIQRAVNVYITTRSQQQAHYAEMRALPSETLDGVPVSLHINAGLFVDTKQLHDLGADGIGLYRTELPYMVAKSFPDVDAQRDTYARVLEQAGDKPVIFRSFDIGGDKHVPYFQTPEEENPAMGWRATRIGLDRPAILRRQFRALLQAGSGKHLHVMFPFISEVAEFDAARILLDMERATLDMPPPASLKVGAMIEIPSILWQLDALLPRLDFVSVGSNDLFQFLFAADRGSPEMADRYDRLNPAMFNVLRHIVTSCEKHGTHLSFCGEMASRPLEAMALVGLGIRQLSMPPSAIGPVKEMIRSLCLGEIKSVLQEQFEAGYRRGYRKLFLAYARDHGIIV
ncbi:MAG: phosphoenolpyruvate--protein phosphotransferase [Alphaproteobacteria bacterium]|nr:phosphoenolpyruvate--protein phosphotransferase [Alphaproteobacteria bacterium]